MTLRVWYLNNHLKVLPPTVRKNDGKLKNAFKKSIALVIFHNLQNLLDLKLSHEGFFYT